MRSVRYHRTRTWQRRMDLSSSSSQRTEASCCTEAERLATSSSRAARGPEAASCGAGVYF